MPSSRETICYYGSADNFLSGWTNISFATEDRLGTTNNQGREKKLLFMGKETSMAFMLRQHYCTVRD